MRPRFFLVGAPKCGTTALAEYLRDHPQVYVSRPKEPFFFSEDLPGLARVTSLDAYLALFEDPPPGTRICGEASAVYLYSDVAIPALRRFEPDARILVMLRHPVDLACSFHAQLVYNQSEDVRDFREAWELQERRARGDALPPRAREPRLLQYRRVAALGSQMERLLSVFPSEQVHVIRSDALARDPGTVYEGVLRFLGVESDGRHVFPRVNERKEARFGWVVRATQRVPRPVSRAVATAKRRLGLEDVGLLDAVRGWNRRPSAAPRLDPAFRARLVEEFRPEVVTLRRLLGPAFDDWLVPAAGASAASSRAARAGLES